MSKSFMGSSIGFQNKCWGNEAKVHARSESVFEMYRKLMGRKALPADKQYWTLAGLHTNDSCELPHALRDGMIASPDQFHGADIADVIAHNRRVYPGAHWYVGDFAHAIEKADPFNPGLLNYDITCVVDNACHNVVQVLFVLLERHVSNALLVVNFLLNNPHMIWHECHSPTDFWEWFYRSSNHSKMLRKALDVGWQVGGETYLYYGADERSNSYLQTVYLFNRKS